MASKKSSPADAAVDSPQTGPVIVPDAGALFQKDRSGDARVAQDTEGKANFAAFSQSIIDAHPQEAA